MLMDLKDLLIKRLLGLIKLQVDFHLLHYDKDKLLEDGMIKHH
jgi:hypothetical protein